MRIGVYDSRAVAFAWFWSEAQQRQLKELMKSARAAKVAGQTNRFQELDATLRQKQDEMHREVFSTAPAAGALAAIKEQISEIEKQTGVTMLVSKWDDQVLRQYQDAEKMDVTDRLVREFIQPTGQQQKVLSEMQRQKPLPLEKCDELIRKGEI
jgi:hypothetical protein